MVYVVQRTHSTSCDSALLELVNDDVAIGVELKQIVDDASGDLFFNFDSVLTAPQEAAFDSLLGSYTCPVIPSPFTSVIQGPSNTQILVYTNGSWLNVDAPTIPDVLDDLSDTTVTSPAEGQGLRYNGSQWVNVATTPPGPVGSFNVIQLFWGPIPAVSGTTSIPKDTSLPQIGEGTEIWGETITPTIGTSSIRIATNVTFSSSNASIELIFAIYRDSVCIGTAVNTTANKSSGFAVSFEIYDTPATASEITYSCRVGKSGGGGTWYINEIHSDIGAFGGTLAQNSYSVEEIGVVI